MSRELEARLERTFADLPEAAPEARGSGSPRSPRGAAPAAPGPARGRRRRRRARGSRHRSPHARRAAGDRDDPSPGRLQGARRPARAARLAPARAARERRDRGRGRRQALALDAPRRPDRGPARLGRRASPRTRSTSASGSAARSSRWRRPAGSRGRTRPAAPSSPSPGRPTGSASPTSSDVGKRYVLRLIEGDGDHDQLVDPAVRPVRPAWRADSLALAYVGAGGHPVVLDLGHDSRQVLGKGCGSASQVAFSVAGSHLAAATDEGIVVDRRCLRGGPAAAGPLGWLGSADLVVVRAGARPMLARIAAGRAAAASAAACLPGPVDALATWAAPNGLAVAIRSGAGSSSARSRGPRAGATVLPFAARSCSTCRARGT